MYLKINEGDSSYKISRTCYAILVQEEEVKEWQGSMGITASRDRGLSEESKNGRGD
ncbi:hypothetical protein [Kroppenstedtia eburnea]|uniref:hypothetical protein n=1 Tax=Kroppenstedtia eburnea TaxID=714067 RepID=UPI0013564E6B|nr:hypothetical protein [Kroppenstedtia eburnea]QKI82858.1 hypothetical protein GXN75_13115 [Kroppenstedtia eburnea]